MTYPQPPAPVGQPGQPLPGHDPAAAYGAGPQPGYGTPPTPRRSGLAVAAFVVGLLMFLISAVPVVNLAAVVGAVVAIVLAVLALRRMQPGVVTGKGLAIAALVLSGLAIVIAVVVNVVVGAALARADVQASDLLAEQPAAEPVVEEPVTAEPVEEPAAAEPAVEETPAEVLPEEPALVEDFSAFTCDDLAAESLWVSESAAEPTAQLIDVRVPVLVEDHRADYVMPTGADESLVLSCRGTGIWADTTETSLYMELTIDAGGELFVAYQAE